MEFTREEAEQIAAAMLAPLSYLPIVTEEYSNEIAKARQSFVGGYVAGRVNSGGCVEATLDDIREEARDEARQLFPILVPLALRSGDRVYVRRGDDIRIIWHASLLQEGFAALVRQPGERPPALGLAVMVDNVPKQDAVLMAFLAKSDGRRPLSETEEREGGVFDDGVLMATLHRGSVA